jgi:ketosteroid isomerase-like protein
MRSNGKYVQCAMLLVLSIVVTGVSTLASNDDHGGLQSLEQQLIQLENDWLKAISQHDTASLDSILADDFLDTTYTGEVRTKRDAILRATAGNNAIDSQRLSDVHVRFYGNTAIVTGLNTVTAKAFGEAKVRFTDVFVKNGNRWQAVSAQETLTGRPPMK